MSRTYRKDKVVQAYSLKRWVAEYLDQYRKFQLFWCEGYPKWGAKFFIPDSEIIKLAEEEWKAHHRDGKGYPRGYHYLSNEGHLIGFRDASSSEKKYPKRSGRRQVKEELRKLVREGYE